MIELEKISVKEFTELEDRSEYEFAMKYASIFTNQKDEYNIGDLKELSFGFIKDFQYEMEQGISWERIIESIVQITKLKNIGSEPLDKMVRFANYLIEGIREIVEVENQTLVSDTTGEEEQAGIDRFEGLGVYLQIRSLTGGDVTKFDLVRSLPYSLCFTELYTAKQIHDFEKERQKIRLNQN